MKAMTAPVASSSNFVLKSSTDIPAASAHNASCSPPAATAVFISSITLENAVPPASALTPTEDRAAASPIISAWLMPITVPAPARRMAISAISPSVVAMLLPKSTITEPRLLKNAVSMPVILANRAKVVAAS